MSTPSPRQFDESFAAAFNAGDLDSLIALYEAGATFIPEPGTEVTGHEAARAALGQFVALNGQIKLRTASVTETGDLALVLSDWNLTGGTGPDGSAVELAGQSTVVLRRQADGGWLCVINDPWSQR